MVICGYLWLSVSDAIKTWDLMINKNLLWLYCGYTVVILWLYCGYTVVICGYTVAICGYTVVICGYL